MTIGQLLQNIQSMLDKEIASLDDIVYIRHEYEDYDISNGVYSGAKCIFIETELEEFDDEEDEDDGDEEEDEKDKE